MKYKNYTKRKYQSAGELLYLNTPEKIKEYNQKQAVKNNTYIPSPTLPNDNYQPKNNNQSIKATNYESKVDNTKVNLPIPKSPEQIKREAEQQRNQQYGTITQNNTTPNLYNTYFNTPSNTHGTGIVPFAANMINAGDVVGVGMLAKQGIKHGSKIISKAVNNNLNSFTPNLSNIGDIGIGNRAQSQFDNFLNLRQSTPINRRSKLYKDLNLNSKEAREFYLDNGVEVSKYSDKDLTDLMYMAAIKDKNLSSPKVVWRGDVNAKNYPELKTINERIKKSSLESSSSANNILGNFFIDKKSAADRYITQIGKSGLPQRMGHTIDSSPLYNSFYDYLTKRGYNNADIRKYMQELGKKNKLSRSPGFKIDPNNPLYLEGSEIRSGFLKYDNPYYQTQYQHFRNPNPHTKYVRKPKEYSPEDYLALEEYLKNKNHDMLIVKKRRNSKDLNNDIEHADQTQYVLPYDKRNNFKSSHPYPSTLERIQLHGSRDWNNPNIYKKLIPPIVGTGIGLSQQKQQRSVRKFGGKFTK